MIEILLTVAFVIGLLTGLWAGITLSVIAHRDDKARKQHTTAMEAFSPRCSR